MKRFLILIAVLAATGFPSAALAQPMAERGYITAAADFLAAGSQWTDEIHPIAFVESATIDSSYPVSFAPGLTVGGGARVWRRLSLGVEVGRVSRSNDVDVSAQVPHPFFFNKPRAVSGTAAGLDRTELAVHVLVSWTKPISRRWQLSVSGGPSWIAVDQDVISDITVTQTYPYDSASFTSAVTRKASKGHVGVNAGIEAAYLFKPRVGLAFGSRFSHAHIPLTASAATDAGGAHVTAGLRLRF